MRFCHLDETQRAMVAARAKDLYAKQAKERQRQSQGRGKKGSENSTDLKGKATDKAGEAVGVSGYSVNAASKVVEPVSNPGRLTVRAEGLITRKLRRMFTSGAANCGQNWMACHPIGPCVRFRSFANARPTPTPNVLRKRPSLWPRRTKVEPLIIYKVPPHPPAHPVTLLCVVFAKTTAHAQPSRDWTTYRDIRATKAGKCVRGRHRRPERVVSETAVFFTRRG
ncbi:hypothetical protein V7x_54880 [Crateriforma conspicua]|uniref:Uncharacterized protein n=1 Tax=Crateriforma conspicua TaxID=2527996 RepID=A0A5C6FJ52_9PLAN|nr:hypothetical protein V7x_54880 [Crateriforma conspicua]